MIAKQANQNSIKILAKKIEGEINLRFINTLFKRLPKLELYVVGGTVRDILLKKKNSKDYDLVARNVGLPTLLKELKKLGAVDMVGRQFGVLKFRPKNSTLKEPIDIALPRTEAAFGTGGYRDVKTSSNPKLPINEDLSRRDLTINAMAWDIKTQEMIDPFNGQQDLINKIIRTVGSPQQRFQEDYSRMLRVIRFSVTLGFKIENRTWQAIKRLMPHINDTRKIEGKDLRVVPYETVGQEILKSFATHQQQALTLWLESGAIKNIIPEIYLPLQNKNQRAKINRYLRRIHSADFNHEFPKTKIKPAFALALILNSVTAPTARKKMLQINEVLIRLRLPKTQTKLIKQVISGLAICRTPQIKRPSVQEKVFNNTYGKEVLMALFLTKPEKAYQKVKSQIKKLFASKNQRGKLPTELLSGQEIMKILRMNKGSHKIAIIKQNLRDQQLSGKIKTKQKALEWVRKNY